MHVASASSGPRHLAMARTYPLRQESYVQVYPEVAGGQAKGALPKYPDWGMISSADRTPRTAGRFTPLGRAGPPPRCEALGRRRQPNRTRHVAGVLPDLRVNQRRHSV